jgi:hypothetical protein
VERLGRGAGEIKSKIMSVEKTLLIKSIVVIGGFIFVNCALLIIWGREQVKKDLQRQGFAPISIRWCPLAYWTWWKETGFIATFVDVTGCIQTARCSLWFSRVRWIGNDYKYLNKNLPLAEKIAYSLLSLFLIYFALKHFFTGELFLRPTLKNPNGVYLHGATLILILFASICYAVSLIVEIVYCYRIWANEKSYTFITRFFRIASCILFLLSLGIYSYQCFKDPSQFYFPSH